MAPDLIPLISHPLSPKGDAVLSAPIRNPNTRLGYARAVSQFFDWCEARWYQLQDLTPILIAGDIEGHPTAKPTVKQHLTAIRMLFDDLIAGGVYPITPAVSVRGPKYVVKWGETPVLTKKKARQLLNSIELNAMVDAV